MSNFSLVLGFWLWFGLWLWLGLWLGSEKSVRVLIFPPEPSKECVKVSHVIFECRVINHHPFSTEKLDCSPLQNLAQLTIVEKILRAKKKYYGWVKRRNTAFR